MDDVAQIPDSLVDKFVSQAGCYRPLPDDVCVAEDIPPFELAPNAATEADALGRATAPSTD